MCAAHFLTASLERSRSDGCGSGVVVICERRWRAGSRKYQRPGRGTEHPGAACPRERRGFNFINFKEDHSTCGSRSVVTKLVQGHLGCCHRGCHLCTHSTQICEGTFSCCDTDTVESDWYRPVTTAKSLDAFKPHI